MRAIDAIREVLALCSRAGGAIASAGCAVLQSCVRAAHPKEKKGVQCSFCYRHLRTLFVCAGGRHLDKRPGVDPRRAKLHASAHVPNRDRDRGAVHTVVWQLLRVVSFVLACLLVANRNLFGICARHVVALVARTHARTHALHATPHARTVGAGTIVDIRRR